MPGNRSGFDGTKTTPATGGEAVTPSDATLLNFTSRALWIGGAGNISLLMEAGDTLLLSGVPAGTLLPVRATRVNATGTTATLIVSLN